MSKKYKTEKEIIKEIKLLKEAIAKLDAKLFPKTLGDILDAE